MIYHESAPGFDTQFKQVFWPRCRPGMYCDERGASSVRLSNVKTADGGGGGGGGVGMCVCLYLSEIDVCFNCKFICTCLAKKTLAVRYFSS